MPVAINTPGRVPATMPNRLARAALELDLPRQLRRLRRRLQHRDHAEELREAVAGKRVLITGASSGIGRAVAGQLLAAGATVILVARRADRLQEVVEASRALPGQAHAYPCDLTREEDIARLVTEVIRDQGGIDILINNAGRSIRRSLADSSERLHDFERVMRINYFAVVWLTSRLVEHMRHQSGGHVINVSTMGTQLRGTPCFAAYMASKGALDQFSDSVAPETLKDGVVWTTVHLPLVNTDMITPAAAAWRHTPTLSLASGASMVISAIIRRPHRVASPLGTLAGNLDRLLPDTLLRLKARPYR
ncbi:SDR family NAD(P)-dependent oxidoreductase [Perlucidibaca piscinae]|uniref:SDR family NAD(P)-dependent oxidoreductase n=1 Tax=Perlucidibaca piscinae TaxID=392589 RepID=UPI0003B65852|nr:SDR family NAD(P)-dependent oxidoreductase [Perlucidibaca piscinae]